MMSFVALVVAAPLIKSDLGPIPGDIKDQIRCGPGQTNLSLLIARRLDKMTFKDPFQHNAVSESVKDKPYSV